MKIRLPHFALFLCLLLALVVFVAPAQAHANLLQSVPEANAQLERSPVQIELFFSEPIEDAFSTIEVLNSSGERVDNDDAQVDPADPTHMTATVRSLPDGIYLVSWRNLSSVDSHIIEGVFPFAVGDVDAGALADAAEASRQVKVSPGEIAARWLTFLSMMTLVGSSLFILLIWEPAVRMAGVGRELEPRWNRLPFIGVLTLLLASVFWLLMQAGHAAGAEFAWPWNPVVGQVLFTTRFGAAWIARIALGAVLLLILPGARSRRERWTALGIGVLLLLTVSFGSHGAAQPQSTLPILADLVHLTAASVWVGGLVYFLLGLHAVRQLDEAQRPRLTAVLIPRFSALGLTSVAVLTLTGLYASLLHVGSADNLLNTIYGRTLLVKLALVLPMVMLGAVNLLVTTPHMRQAAEVGNSMWVGRFRRLLTSEVTLGVAVLLSVAVLTTLPPPEFPGDTADLSETQVVDDLEISLELSPGRPGLNTFTATVTQNGQPAANVREVELQFTPTTVDLPPGTAQLSGQGGGVYSIQGGFLALPDAYQLQVAVRRTDAFDAFANFDFKVGTTAAPASSNSDWYRFSGLLMIGAGVVFVFALGTLIRQRRQSVVLGGVSVLALSIVGIAVFFSPPVQEGGLPVNPIPPNADSIATGEMLYQENCLPCHGETGAGDGPVGRTLNPPPADLTLHTQPGVHPDGRLYNWITNGFPDSVMPAFKDKLTDEERWHLVNYIRTLAR